VTSITFGEYSGETLFAAVAFSDFSPYGNMML